MIIVSDYLLSCRISECYTTCLSFCTHWRSYNDSSTLSRKQKYV